jgi:hypothetical protein
MLFAVLQRIAMWSCTAVVVLAIPATPAFAQFGGGPMGRGGMGGPAGVDMERRPPAERRSVSASGEHLVADMMQQFDNVRHALRLRPEQEPQWGIYQEKVGALVSDQMRPGSETAGGNALRQMQRKIDVVRNRLAALEDIADAARGLYQRLDAEQQETADRLLPATLPALYSGLRAERSGNPGRLPENSAGRGGPPSR